MRKPPRRKCTVCREWFHPVRAEQYVCSYECACVHGKAANDAAKAEKQRKEKSVVWRKKEPIASARPSAGWQ
jgi:hypothetical protein